MAREDISAVIIHVTLKTSKLTHPLPTGISISPIPIPRYAAPPHSGPPIFNGTRAYALFMLRNLLIFRVLTPAKTKNTVTIISGTTLNTTFAAVLFLKLGFAINTDSIA
jgi:hypothetical protein